MELSRFYHAALRYPPTGDGTEGASAPTSGIRERNSNTARSCATLSDMHPERRDFMKCGALSVLGLAGERALEAVPFAPNI